MTAKKQLLNRVIVVDDNPDIAMLICSFLESTGDFQAQHIDNPNAALEACQQQPCDLLIVDHFMAGMDGTELLAALRKSNRNIPAIMISGNPGVADYIETSNTAFLAKPFSMNRLLEEATKIMRSGGVGP
jgi:CheY-like chemotaxis protein